MSLDNILPTANCFTAGDDESTPLSTAGRTNGEPFAQVMSRAMSPRGTNVAAAPNRRPQAGISASQKRSAMGSKSSSDSDQISGQSSPMDADSGVPV